MTEGKIVIYGGTSEISKETIIQFSKKFNNFLIFTRNINKVKKYIREINNPNLKFSINKVDIINLKKNITLINKIKNYSIDGLIWIAGTTGNPVVEENNQSLCKKNIEINFLNPVILINKFILKLKKKNCFIVVLTSVAGIRGRKKRLFYSSAKAGLINYLSGLRQKYHSRINIITIIPGYINTPPFRKLNIKASRFLITEPSSVAKTIYNSVKHNKDIVFVNKIWKLIMFLINLIPEKIFKKLNF